LGPSIRSGAKTLFHPDVPPAGEQPGHDALLCRQTNYALNQRNTLTFSTFGAFTKIVGFRVGVAIVGGTALSGFGADPNSFSSRAQLGGANYTVRMNSTITPNWIGEFAFGAHSQRNNLIAPAVVANTEAVTDNFAILRNGAVLPVTDTNVDFGGFTGFLAFVDGRGGSLERGFARQGFGGVVTNRIATAMKLRPATEHLWSPHL
jgi:hypothetical protein